MTDEIQLISDGDGLAVIGESAAVDAFLRSQGLPSKELPLDRLRPVVGAAGNLAQVGSQIAANSGRWVQLTEKSAHLVKTSNLMTGSSAGVSRAVAVTKNGQITDLLEFSKGSAHLLTNPAVLAGVGGIMAQYAMQQTMDEIVEYLQVIDAKVDDVLRNQKDAVLADMIGVDLVIEEALTIREHVGRVSDVTWSKVQGTVLTIAKTQAYALRQLDALAEKLEKKPHVDDTAIVAKEAEATVQEWLAVLARCFQLQDAIGVLELDRVLDASPEELDQHRTGLQAARRNRRDLIARTTGQLMARMDVAAQHANTKVFLNPINAPTVVRASNSVATAVVAFHKPLGIEGSRESLESTRWLVAAVDARDKAVVVGGDVRDKALELGGAGVGAAKVIGGEGLDRAKAAGARLTGGLAERLGRRRGGVEE